MQANMKKIYVSLLKIYNKKALKNLFSVKYIIYRMLFFLFSWFNHYLILNV